MSTLWTETELATFMRMNDEGRSAAEIARATGRTISAVRSLCKRSQRVVDRQAPWSEADRATLASLREQGVQMAEIAHRLGRTHAAVKTASVKYGISPRRAEREPTTQKPQKPKASPDSKNPKGSYSREEIAWAAAQIEARANDPQAQLIAGLHTGIPWLVFRDADRSDAMRWRQRISIGGEA